MLNKGLQLGINEDILVLRNDEMQTEILADMFRQSRTIVQIFSRDLEPHIFRYQAIYQPLATMISQNQRAKIEILIQDVDAVVKVDHALVELMRNMSSFVEIKKTSLEYKQYEHNFVLIDDCAYYYHRHPQDSSEFEICYNNRSKVRKFSNQFKIMWDKGIRATELLRLYI